MNALDKFINIFVNNKAANDSLKETSEEMTKVTQATDASTGSIKINNDAILQQSGLLDTLNTITGGLSGTIIKLSSAVDISSLSLKTFRGALISTGLGAIVVVLGSLIAYLTTTQEGIDKVTSVLRPLQTIFGALLGLVQNLGKSLFDAFANPRKTLSDLADFVQTNLINRFKAFSVVLEGIINLDFKKITDGVLQGATGVENLSSKITNAAAQTGKFLSDAAKKGVEIDRLTKELTKTEGAYIISQSKLKAELKEQNKIAEDTTKTNAQRQVAIQKALDLQKAITKEVQARLDKEIKLLKTKQSVNDTSDEELKKLAELQVKKNEATASAAENDTTLQNKQNAIIKEANDKRAAANKLIQDKKDAEKKQARDAEKAALIENELSILSARDRELKVIDDKFNEQIELNKKAGISSVGLELQKTNELKAINKKYDDEIEKTKIATAERIAKNVKTFEEKTALEKLTEQFNTTNNQLIADGATQEQQLVLLNDYNVKKQAIIDADNKLIADKKKAEAEKDIADEKAFQDSKNGVIATSKQNLNDIISGLETTQLAKSKAGQALSKALALTQIGIDSAVALGNASKLANAEGVAAQLAFPTVPGAGTIARVISYTSTAAQVAGNIVRAKQMLSSNGGAGGAASAASNGGAGGAGGGAQAQFNIVGSSGTNQLAATIAGSQNQPVQSYVVGSDVSSQQALDRNRVNTATFL